MQPCRCRKITGIFNRWRCHWNRAIPRAVNFGWTCFPAIFTTNFERSWPTISVSIAQKAGFGEFSSKKGVYTRLLTGCKCEGRGFLLADFLRYGYRSDDAGRIIFKYASWVADNSIECCFDWDSVDVCEFSSNWMDMKVISRIVFLHIMRSRKVIESSLFHVGIGNGSV